jgi:hypothetical protein
MTVIYDRFSDTSKHSAKWVRITKEFLKLAFAGGRREASCPCSRCENKRMLSKYEMFAFLAKKGFMSNYLLWHQHGEVQPVVADELDGNDDVNPMDDMVTDIGRGYDLESEDPPLELGMLCHILYLGMVTAGGQQVPVWSWTHWALKPYVDQGTFRMWWQRCSG